MRISDAEGDLWTVTGQRCPACHLPADPTLDGTAHPHCTDAREVDPIEHLEAIAALLNCLAAEVTGTYTLTWIRSGDPTLALEVTKEVIESHSDRLGVLHDRLTTLSVVAPVTGGGPVSDRARPCCRGRE